MNKKITSAVFLPLLFVASQSAYATYYYGGCPAGTTGSSVGFGIISSSGAFWPSTSGSLVYSCGSSQSHEVVDTITTNTLQIERGTYNTINQHLMSKVVREYSASSSENKAAASSDSDSYKPDTVWGETNITSLTEHKKNQPGFASNIYQFTGGLDKRYGDLFYGAALTYAYTDNNLVNNTDNTMHTVGISPYMAYKINDFLFASALGSYYYSNTSGGAGYKSIDTHDYSGEANINAFKVIDAFTLKGRAGVRYKHANSSQKGGMAGRDNTFDEITGIVDAQLDYKFDNGLTLYTGALYNHYAREASAVSSLVRGNDVVWMRYGAEYPVTKGFLIGAKIENDLNDKQTNYLTGSVNFRLEL
jgi:hypothetical protein